MNTYVRPRSPDVWFLTITAMFLSEVFQLINASLLLGNVVNASASSSVSCLYTLRILAPGLWILSIRSLPVTYGRR